MINRKLLLLELEKVKCEIATMEDALRPLYKKRARLTLLASPAVKIALTWGSHEGRNLVSASLEDSGTDSIWASGETAEEAVRLLFEGGEDAEKV